MVKDKCPLCKGTGKSQTFNSDRKTIKLLRSKGLTVREIAKVVKKSPTTVFYHLKV